MGLDRPRRRAAAVEKIKDRQKREQTIEGVSPEWLIDQSKPNFSEKEKLLKGLDESELQPLAKKFREEETIIAAWIVLSKGLNEFT